MRNKIYLIILFITTTSYLAPAQEPVHFADANLKAAVEEALGIADPTPTDMLALTWLYAHDLGISDLTGLEHAKNIEGLYLFDNQISDISALAGLTNLKNLFLSNNQISDISALAGLMNLLHLNLRGNPLGYDVCETYIPHIRENNPGVDIQHDPCILSGRLYVDDDAPGDPGAGDSQFSDINEDGTPDHPYDTIQEAMDAAEDGYTVFVYPGIYREEINFLGKAVTVKGIATSAGIPVLENPDGIAVAFENNEGPDSILKNFVIRNSFMAILIEGCSPTITNITIVDNTYDVGAYNLAEPNISNCIFWSNTYNNLFQIDTSYSWIKEKYEHEILEGLVSHWKFDEGDGTTAYDLVGDNHGIIYGPQWSIGRIDGALCFDGEDDYVKLPDNSPTWLPQYDFSLSAWVYFERDDIFSVSDSEVILDLNYGASAYPENELGYNIQRRGDTGKLCFQITTTTNSDEDLYSNEVLATNTWYHIVALRDGETQAIYINGMLDSSRKCSTDPIVFAGGYDDDSVNIGRFTTNIGNPRYHLKGKIDDVMIFENPLSLQTIKLLYQNGLSGRSFDANPLFADPYNGDYHLRSEYGRYWPEHDVWLLDKVTSPCIDAGDPIIDPLNEPLPNGGRINIGAYGGTAYASKSESKLEEPVYFADANLKAAVERQLGISDPTPTDMLALNNLRATICGISDLTGLEFAKNLELLFLDKNQVSDISMLAGLKNLRHLQMPYNQLNDISALADLTNLTVLYLYENHIRDLSALVALTNLKDLQLYQNDISDISALAGLTNLTYLDLCNNQINDISVLSGLTNLKMLSLDRNQIGDISLLSGLIKLQSLSLSYNLISDVSALSKLTNLQELFLKENQISDISQLSNLTSLLTLYLSRNQISDISPLSRLVSLQQLILDRNQISDISSLSGLLSLHALTLKSNPICDISVLSGLTNLQILWLIDNQISDISPLSGLTNLQILLLSVNKIKDLSPLSELTNLVTLGLEYNQISNLSPLSGIRSLKFLGLDGNQISDLSALAGLTNLMGLNLWGNQINDISALIELKNLNSLGLGANPLNYDSCYIYIPLIRENNPGINIHHEPCSNDGP